MKKHKIKLILLISFLLLFIITAALVFSGMLESFELLVYDTIAKLISPSMTAILKVVTYGGSFPLLCGLALLLVILPPTRKKYGFPVALTAVVSAIVNLILKQIFRRQRPDILRLVTELGYGFPSGHTQSCTAFFIALALIILVTVKNKKVLIPSFALCILIPLIVGFSRVYLGVHHAGDILAGWTIGVFVALAVNILWQALNSKLKKHKKLHQFFFEDKKETIDCPGN